METENGTQACDELYTATCIARGVHESGQEIKQCYLEPKPEDEALIKHAKECGKWFPDYKTIYGEEPFDYGAESDVYLHENSLDVVKINSGSYHSNWLELLIRIAAHNYYFPNTAYTLEGYTYKDDRLAIILFQPYIRFNRLATVEEIQKDLEDNYEFIFKNIREVHDPKHNIILRDFHYKNAYIDQYNDVVYVDVVIDFQENSTMPTLYIT